MHKTILLATGHEPLNRKISEFQGYTFVGEVDYRKDLIEKTMETNPEIVIVSDYLTGKESTPELLVRLHNHCPNVRVLYITNKVAMNDVQKVMGLGNLVLLGIYPLIVDGKLTPTNIEYVLEHPTKEEEVSYLLKYHRDTSKKKENLFELEEEEVIEDVEEDGYKNVINISSIKPGTGKSFISVNTSLNIAKYGKKKDGHPPTVAIIEADLQNLSLGTLLGIEDEKYNLKTAMEKIATIVNKDGDLVDDIVKINEVNKFVLECFRPYYGVSNLKALVGSQLTMEEIEDIHEYLYLYLVELVATEFDVVIIDTNSSLAHVTTYPLLRLATKTYYILNLDFNNIRNNARYKSTLENMGVLDKVSYVLNENHDPEYMKMYGVEEPEELEFTEKEVRDSDFDLAGSLPMIPKSVFLNRLFNGTPIVLDESTDAYTLLPRLEFARLANQIWAIDNLEWLENEYEKQRKRFVESKTKKGLFKK
ncbi:AAA family ATPase [Rossellomorea marisflavi]|uniref:AAA family ATPase n=1 Tax=Rossellomorea marisflavi TaxID=189381 RepID=UPI003FA06250